VSDASRSTRVLPEVRSALEASLVDVAAVRAPLS